MDQEHDFVVTHGISLWIPAGRKPLDRREAAVGSRQDPKRQGKAREYSPTARRLPGAIDGGAVGRPPIGPRRHVRDGAGDRSGIPRHLRSLDRPVRGMPAPTCAITLRATGSGRVASRFAPSAATVAAGPRGRVSMSNSSSSGKFARDASKPARKAPRRPTNGPRRAPRPATQEELDEWQATRVQSRRAERQPTNGACRNARAARPPAAPIDAPAARAAGRIARRLGRRRARRPRSRPSSSRTRTTTSPPRRTRSAGRSAATSASCSSRARRPRRCSSSSSTCSPNFIAVHDIATSSSRKLLTGIAAASGRAVQKLVDPPPGLRHGAGDARVRRAADRRQPARCASTPPRPMPTRASRHAHRHGCCSPTAGSASMMVGELPGHAIARGAEAAARRHHRRPLAEPQPAAAAARLGEHARHARPRPRPRHRRRRAHDAAGRPAGRCLGLHHRHLEPPARAGADRRPRRARARRLQAAPPISRASAPPPVTGGMPSGDTLPMEDPRPPVVLTMRPMPAIAGRRLQRDDAVDADRALRQAGERAERRRQLLRLRGRRAATPIAHAGANPGLGRARRPRQRADRPR